MPPFEDALSHGPGLRAALLAAALSMAAVLAPAAQPAWARPTPPSRPPIGPLDPSFGRGGVLSSPLLESERVVSGSIAGDDRPVFGTDFARLLRAKGTNLSSVPALPNSFSTPGGQSISLTERTARSRQLARTGRRCSSRGSIGRLISRPGSEPPESPEPPTWFRASRRSSSCQAAGQPSPSPIRDRQRLPSRSSIRPVRRRQVSELAGLRESRSRASHGARGSTLARFSTMAPGASWSSARSRMNAGLSRSASSSGSTLLGRSRQGPSTQLRNRWTPGPGLLTPPSIRKAGC